MCEVDSRDFRNACGHFVTGVTVITTRCAGEGDHGMTANAFMSISLVPPLIAVSIADKAKMLNDKKLEPSLLDPRAGVKLVIPSLEKVGKLRQTSTPEAGRSYWMAFLNKGRLVKRGDHVDLVIGPFRAQGLVVD